MIRSLSLTSKLRRPSASVCCQSRRCFYGHDGYYQYSTSAALENDEVRSYDTIPDEFRELVDEYCHKQMTPVSMHELVKAGRPSADDMSRKGTLSRKTLIHRQPSAVSGKTLIQVSEKGLHVPDRLQE